MSDPSDIQLLIEIRDLLKEQNHLIAAIKTSNEEAAARAAEHMAKAESQNAVALGTIGNARWLTWGVWVFLALLLLIFAGPMLWRA